MEAAYLQLAFFSVLPVEVTSESLETATIVFVCERASRGYLAYPNRSVDEGDMAVLRKSRSAGADGYPKAWREQKVPPGRVAFGHQNPPGRVATRRHGGNNKFHPGGWLSATKFHPGGWPTQRLEFLGLFLGIWPSTINRTLSHFLLRL